jgi:hypothetical protein
MRVLAIIFFVLAVALTLDAARDQYRGLAEATAPRMLPASASKQNDPQGFRGLMAFEWIRVALCAGAGFTFWSLDRRSRRLDPFSPDVP